MKRFAKSYKNIHRFSLLLFFILACTCNGATMATITKSTITSIGIISKTEIVTEQLISSPELSTNTVIQPTKTSNNPFSLLGIWKADDMHAPDNSWSISYSIYMKFTNTKQYVYHGIDAFNSKIPTDESDLVYINNNDSIFIKKLVNIPNQPEYLGKYQKWSWRFRNGNALFTIYSLVDSQELALNDGTINGLATGVKVQQ